MTREINGKTTLPLNGYRGRKLAEYHFGDYYAEKKFYQGMRFIVPAEVLKKLPDFDSKNYAYADSFEGDVICTIEYVDPSYGFHISVTKAPTIKDMNTDSYGGRWADYIRVSIDKDGYVRVYWRDIRPEDFMMFIRPEELPKAKELIEEKNLCQYYWCTNDLAFRVIQMYGAELNEKIEKAGVL